MGERPTRLERRPKLGSIPLITTSTYFAKKS